MDAIIFNKNSKKINCIVHNVYNFDNHNIYGDSELIGLSEYADFILVKESVQIPKSGKKNRFGNFESININDYKNIRPETQSTKESKENARQYLADTDYVILKAAERLILESTADESDKNIVNQRISKRKIL